jgi:hypothetical protein
VAQFAAQIGDPLSTCAAEPFQFAAPRTLDSIVDSQVHRSSDHALTFDLSLMHFDEIVWHLFDRYECLDQQLAPGLSGCASESL